MNLAHLWLEIRRLSTVHAHLAAATVPERPEDAEAHDRATRAARDDLWRLWEAVHREAERRMAELGPPEGQSAGYVSEGWRTG